ncbi:unnamed protein product [Lepeophtheirus salmonis]|uniref:(salmon louse) hypothetical protein n=1 Tax=Lepeophtheirus salmonis TaxID=72036 RepID=A0A817FAG6_LEPSM|nr:unnamed protein product [Lepeophtheirus salmonis]CAG9475727.1 unnamed protein product [Lepeophtheirus salmonis]
MEEELLRHRLGSNFHCSYSGPSVATVLKFGIIQTRRRRNHINKHKALKRNWMKMVKYLLTNGHLNTLIVQSQWTGICRTLFPKYPYYGGGDSRMDFAQMRALPSMTTGIRRVKGSFASWTPEWNRMSSLGSKRIVWKRSICSKVGEMEKNFICLKNRGGSSNLYPNGGSLSDGPEDIYDYAD